MAYIQWNPKDLHIVLPVACASFSFVIYWMSTHSERVKTFFHSQHPFDRASIYYLLFSKISGFTILGLIPLIICSIFLPGYSFGLAYKPDQLGTTFTWFGLLALIIIPFTYFLSKKPENLLHHPQLRIRQWSYNTVILYFSAWAVYLLGYELLFRGILLLPLVETLGPWPAIAINTALYSGVHLLNSPKESIASIPFGMLLCVITIQTEMIWAAFLVHLCLPWTNAITSLKYHPDITIVRNKK